MPNHLEKIFDYSTDMINTIALQTACEFKIADHIKAGKKTILALANSCEVNEKALTRLMRLLVKQNFFSEKNGNFELTELSSFLLSNSENSMREFLMHMDESRWRSMQNLKLAIKTGEPAFNQLYQMDFFTYLTKNPEAMAHFNRGQTNLAETKTSEMQCLLNQNY